jgi:hypothetical protein
MRGEGGAEEGGEVDDPEEQVCAGEREREGEIRGWGRPRDRQGEREGDTDTETEGKREGRGLRDDDCDVYSPEQRVSLSFFLSLFLSLPVCVCVCVCVCMCECILSAACPLIDAACLSATCPLPLSLSLCLSVSLNDFPYTHTPSFTNACTHVSPASSIGVCARERERESQHPGAGHSFVFAGHSCWVLACGAPPLGPCFACRLLLRPPLPLGWCCVVD